MPKQKEYSEDIKSAVNAALKNEKSQAQVATDFNLSRQIISFSTVKSSTQGRLARNKIRDDGQNSLNTYLGLSAA